MFLPSPLSFLPPAFSERSQPPPFFPEWGKGIWPCKDRFGEWKKGKRNKRKSIAHCPLFSLWGVRSLLQKEGKGQGLREVHVQNQDPPSLPRGGGQPRVPGERTPWGQQWALRGPGSTHALRLPALSTLLLLASPRHLQQAEPEQRQAGGAGPATLPALGLRWGPSQPRALSRRRWR